MSREYPEYRDVLEDIMRTFGDKSWITLDELKQYDGSGCTRTIKRRYGIPKGITGINRNVLARRICQIARGEFSI